MNNLRDFLRGVIGRSNKQMLRQEALLRISLLEIGLDPGWFNIKVDHKNGRSAINGYEVGLVFPRVFFEVGEHYSKVEKKYEFQFNGFIGTDRARQKMIRPFEGEASLITFSMDGRAKHAKGMFNAKYFNEIASSKFTLCPHQQDWPHKNSIIWTYRFVDACIGYSIPVVFRRTPLSESFTKGIYYVFDDEVFDAKKIYEREKAADNFMLARKRFTFSEKCCEDLWSLV